MTAIKCVGSVLAPYDSDQLIPVYGFGARVPPQGDVSHCFPLTFRDDAPAVFGVQVTNQQSTVTLKDMTILFSNACSSLALVHGLVIINARMLKHLLLYICSTTSTRTSFTHIA